MEEPSPKDWVMVMGKGDGQVVGVLKDGLQRSDQVKDGRYGKITGIKKGQVFQDDKTSG